MVMIAARPRAREHVLDSLFSPVIHSSSTTNPRIGPDDISFLVDAVGRTVAGTQVREESPGSTGHAAR
jgi:hypothetical protein